jgi:hypothetical protein
MLKNRVIFALFLLLGSTLALWADGGVEYENRLITSSGENYFTVSKMTGVNDPTDAFVAQKADFSYVIKVINADNEDTILFTYKGSSSVPAGKIETRIDATKYIKDLKGKIKVQGRIDLDISVPSTAKYGGSSTESIVVRK